MNHFRYVVYRANSSGTGHAAQIECRETERGAACFLSTAHQNGQDDKTFDWKNKINVSLGLSDLGEMLAVLQRRQNDCKLYHESPGGGNKLIKLDKTEKGYNLSVSFKNGEENDKGFVSLSHGDASILADLLSKAAAYQCLVKRNDE